MTMMKTIFENISFQTFLLLFTSMEVVLIGKTLVSVRLTSSMRICSALTHRRELCQRLRNELKYDVIAFDYRGFADSTGESTEKDLVKDAKFIYDWLQKLNNHQRKIYLWGHAFGSAVASQLAAELSQHEGMVLFFSESLIIILSFSDKNLGGIVMEAPFLNVHQALLTHWISLVSFLLNLTYLTDSLHSFFVGNRGTIV